MKVFTYSEARQNLAKLLVLAQEEEIEIRRRDGAVFVLDVKTATGDIAIRYSGYQDQGDDPRHRGRSARFQNGMRRHRVTWRWEKSTSAFPSAPASARGPTITTKRPAPGVFYVVPKSKPVYSGDALLFAPFPLVLP
jgi:hypothetical protein